MRPASPEIDNEKEEIEMAALRSRIKSSSTPEQSRSQPWAFVVIFVLLAVVIGSVFYTCSQNRALSNRMDQLEKAFQVATIPTMSPEKEQGQLAAIEESLAVLKQLAKENQDATRTLEGKIQTIEENVAQLKTPPTQSPSASVKKAPAQQKAAPAPPQKTTPKEQSAGSFHVVEKGENLFRISVKYNVALDRLAEINNMKVNDPIYPGQKIKLP
jgi:LysM repeat protein